MRKHISSSANEHFTKLTQFRQAAYDSMERARDALFELSDAVIERPHVRSLAELSCSPVFRRKWSSTYEALDDGLLNRENLMRLCIGHIAEEGRPILAGDHTAWTRLWARTLPDRTYEHQSTPVPGRRPITIGHAYSTVVWVPETEGSWALPLLNERISSTETPCEKASQQLEGVCKALSVRPITLWDSEYGCAKFVRQTSHIPADKIIRLRTNLCLYGAPDRCKGRGAKPKHGRKIKFHDPGTWQNPDETLHVDAAGFGPMVVRVWNQVHFRQAPDHPFILAQIERQQAPYTKRTPRVLWFAWVGLDPPRADWWQLYTRRYTVDHWYRFAKGRLHWTQPMLSTPQRCELWSDLMMLNTWELWLARPIVHDEALPWQKPQPRPVPGRVCQGMAGILAVIGTPAQSPKPRGKSPGWPVGRSRKRKERFAVVRSSRYKPKPQPSAA